MTSVAGVQHAHAHAQLEEEISRKAPLLAVGQGLKVRARGSGIAHRGLLGRHSCDRSGGRIVVRCGFGRVSGLVGCSVVGCRRFGPGCVGLKNRVDQPER